MFSLTQKKQTFTYSSRRLGKVYSDVSQTLHFDEASPERPPGGCVLLGVLGVNARP